MMNVYRAEYVMELGSKYSVPEREKQARACLCERTDALCNDEGV